MKIAAASDTSSIREGLVVGGDQGGSVNQPDKLKATPISLTTPDFLDFANCHRDQNDRHFLQKLCRSVQSVQRPENINNLYPSSRLDGKASGQSAHRDWSNLALRKPAASRL